MSGGLLLRPEPSMHSRIKRGASLALVSKHGAANDGAASAIFHDTIESGVE